MVTSDEDEGSQCEESQWEGSQWEGSRGSAEESEIPSAGSEMDAEFRSGAYALRADGVGGLRESLVDSDFDS